MAFDYTKYQVQRGGEEVLVLVGGEELKLTIRKLPWARKNQIVSQCMSWDDSGKSHFDTDMYVRECLKYMVISAPWGETNDLFLLSIDDILGRALQTIVPQASGGETKGAKVEEVKKE